MENASKALLIAGAVLIVILIIGVGMTIFRSASGSFSEATAQMSSQEVEMYNTQFTQYAGKRVIGTNVKALIEKINANNVMYSDEKAKTIKLTATGIIKGSSPNFTFDGADASTARFYTVTVTDSDQDGLVETINITANKK